MDLADELWSHRAWLTGVARGLLARSGLTCDADDLAQQSLVWAWEHWDLHDQTRPVRGWLYLILRRNWIASLQSRDRQHRLIGTITKAARFSHGSPPPDTAVYDMLAGLSDRVADVAEARYLGGYTYDETAVMLGLPVSTVTGRLNEARKKLAKATVH
jgi:RNA polymerase sigma-70 factor, ECF subfamily